MSLFIGWYISQNSDSISFKEVTLGISWCFLFMFYCVIKALNFVLQVEMVSTCSKFSLAGDNKIRSSRYIPQHATSNHPSEFSFLNLSCLKHYCSLFFLSPRPFLFGLNWMSFAGLGEQAEIKFEHFWACFKEGWGKSGLHTRIHTTNFSLYVSCSKTQVHDQMRSFNFRDFNVRF